MYECIEKATQRYTHATHTSRVGTYADDNSAFDAANGKYFDLILSGIKPEFNYFNLPDPKIIAELSWTTSNYDILQVYKEV